MQSSDRAPGTEAPAQARRDGGDPLIGRLVDGRYRIGSRIARGGMASVYQAADIRLDRTVAVKVMHVGLGDDNEFAARFVREARAAARISHPNVVAVFDQGDDNGVVFLAMEYIHGHTLRDVIRSDAPIAPARALSLFEPILAALAAAHRAGLIHRDMKPENVLIAEDGRLKVADFGLAKAVSTDTQHTATGGVLIGTVSYLAPELVVEGRADPRADVYAAGVMLYELLTGKKPHEGESPIQVAYKHVHEDVPPPSDLVPTLPAYVDALVARATARDRAQRPTDAGVLLHQVRRVSQALAAGVTDDPELTSDLALPKPRPDSDPTLLVAPETDDPADVETGDVVPVAADTEADGTDWTDETPAPEESWPEDAAADDQTELEGPPPREFDPVAMVAGASPPPSVPSWSGSPLHENTTALERLPRPPDPPSGGGSPPPPVPRRPRRSRRGPILLVLALLVAAAVGGGAWWYGYARYTQTPGVLGLSQSAAEEKLVSAGLVPGTAKEEYSETVKAGEVIDSDPEPGSRILDGATVTLTISLGKERYDVPKLIGLTENKAQDKIARNHLTFGGSTGRWSETVRKGRVISSDPAAGTSLKRDTPVELVISKGRKPIRFADWTGKDAEDARRTLEAKGLKVDVSQEEYSSTVPAGSVISQSPRTGTLFKGDTITLVVSKGPEMVEIPRDGVIAAGVDDATQTLEDLGFVVDVEKDPTYLGLGYVLRTDPSPGTSVPKGSTVIIYLI